MTKEHLDELERVIKRALKPGTYIGHRERADFIEAVKAKITPLIREDGGAVRAVALLEFFIAGCYGKAAVAVLGRGGLRALERTAREMADASGKDSYAGDPHKPPAEDRVHLRL